MKRRVPFAFFPRSIAIVAAFLVAFAFEGVAAPIERGAAERQPHAEREPTESQTEMTFTPDTKAVRLLYEAVQHKDPAVVEKAFAEGADANATMTFRRGQPKEESMPLLCLASFAVDDEQKRAVIIFRAFLAHGLDLKAKNGEGETPLFWAFSLENDGLVREVVERGADINAIRAAPSGFGGGNIVNAVVGNTIRGHDEKTLPLLLFLLEHHADPNRYDASGMTPLHFACLLGFPRTVAALLSHGADPYAKTHGPSGPSRGTSLSAGQSAIQMAARTGNSELLRLLAKATPGLSAADAASAGASDALRRLLDTGAASANGVSDNKTPLLILAARSGDVPTVRLLLGRGAKVDARTTQGATALYEAAALNQPEIARLLLAHHANPNAAFVPSNNTPFGPSTPLAAAIYAPSPEVVGLLLRHGATVSQGRGKVNALTLAVRNAGGVPLRRRSQDPKRVLRGDALLQAQESVFDQVAAKTNVRRDGGPALAAAVERGQWGLAQALMEKGANVNAHNESGASVLILTVGEIGSRRYEASPEMMKMESLEGEEIKTRRAEAAADEVEGMAFLHQLMRRHPNLDELCPPGIAEKPSTALRIARFWKIPDVETILKKAGAHR